jgi:hypothetical protein
MFLLSISVVVGKLCSTLATSFQAAVAAAQTFQVLPIQDSSEISPDGVGHHRAIILPIRRDGVEIKMVFLAFANFIINSSDVFPRPRILRRLQKGV